MNIVDINIFKNDFTKLKVNVQIKLVWMSIQVITPSYIIRNIHTRIVFLMWITFVVECLTSNYITIYMIQVDAYNSESIYQTKHCICLITVFN